MISILMPMYNAAPFINACIDSIINQSFTDWELIIVNDFSDDSSTEIVQTYQELDSRIICINNTQKGIQNALRLALQISSYELITRMDADDLMPDQKLEHMVNAWHRHGKGHIITGKVFYFSDHEIGNGYIKYTNWLNQLGDDRFGEIYKECVIPSSCWLLHKDDLVACGAFQSDSYPEDYQLCFQFYQYGLQVKSIDKVLHHWRDHTTRTSRNSPVYADNTFLALKMKFFIRHDYPMNKKLIVWGSGKKGKRISACLQKANLRFTWISNNPNKIGHQIYQQEIIDVENAHFEEATVIIGFFSKDAEKRDILTTCKLANKVFFFA